MGFIKKWGKIIVAVVIFVGILGLVVRIPGAGSTGIPTPEPTENPTEGSTPVPTLSPVQTQPPRIPEPTPQPTFSPISSSTPPLSTPEPPPNTSPSVSQTQEPSTVSPEEKQEMPTTSPEDTQELPAISPEEEKQDMTLEVQENTCASGHDFHKSVWETATCMKGGYYNNVCGRCGLVESVTEEPLPHDVEDILIQEGNCMQDTVIRHVCKSCGQQVQSDTRYTPEVHKWVCTVVDDKEVFYCEWCGIVQ